MIDLTLFSANSHDEPAALIGDLRSAFPGNDAIYGDGPGDGNPAITELVKARLQARCPEVAARVKFDPEYSAFYCYGSEYDLLTVRSLVAIMAEEVGS